MISAVLAGLLALPLWAGDGAAGRVIAVYPDRNTTKLVVEAREPLVAASNVFVGPDEVQATLGDVLSRSGDLYYFSASVPGKADVKIGDEVLTQRERRLETPNPLRLKISENYTFEQKRKGEVTAVQDGRAMIDRGTLHEVRERDLYRVYGADKRYKGLLEIRGIGDLQSSGELYNALEDRRRDALKTAPGDRVVFAGQRKLFALGLVGGVQPSNGRAFGVPENSTGAGLLWGLTFRDGWGVEVLFGYYGRDLKESRVVGSTSFGNARIDERLSRSARFLAPIWLKKSFFFPAIVSPYLAAGGSLFMGDLRYESVYTPPNAVMLGIPNTYINDKGKSLTVVPVLGGGVEFFPARFFRPRLEVRWFDGPTMHAGPETFDTESAFVSAGFFTAW